MVIYKRRIGGWLLWRAGPAEQGRLPLHGPGRQRPRPAVHLPALPRRHRHGGGARRRRPHAGSGPGRRRCGTRRRRDFRPRRPGVPSGHGSGTRTAADREASGSASRASSASGRPRGSARESETGSISELSSNDQHQGDLGTETFEREKDFSLLEQLEAEIGDLDAALRKIDEGTYGICEVCGTEIDPERLEAMPGTRTCIEHAGARLTARSTPSALGRSTEEREFKVEAPRTVAYAAATNDTNERHTGGELAPPVFAIVPVWDVMTAAAGLVTPPEAFEQVVHSEQDMRFFRPIAPGDVLRSKATPVYVAVRGVGTTVAVRTETVDAHRRSGQRAVRHPVLPRSRSRGGAAASPPRSTS